MPKIFFLYCLIYCFGCGTAAAQPKHKLLWAREHGGYRDEDCCVPFTLATRDGGVLLGVALGSFKKYPPTNQGSGPFLILKFDSRGNLLWHLRPYEVGLHIRINKAVEDPSGNCYLAGYIYGDNFNGGAWILKVDVKGRIVWSRFYKGNEKAEAFFDLHLLPNGRLWAGGDTRSASGDVPYNAGLWDCWLVELDTAGNILRSLTYGSTETETLSSMTPLPNGGFMITGIRYVIPLENYNPISSSDFIDADNFVVITDPDGNMVDSMLLTDPTLERASEKIFVTPTGYIGVGEYEKPGWRLDISIFAVQYDKQWRKIREKNWGGAATYYTDALQTPEGNVLLLGQDGSKFGRPSDIVLMCIDTDLDTLWTFRQDTAEPSVTFAGGLSRCPDGSGYFVGGTVFERGENAQGSNTWVGKFVAGTRPISPCDDFQIYPNPILGDELQIEFRNELKRQDLPWQLIDALGRVVDFGTFVSDYPASIQFQANRPAGLYWVRLGCPDGWAAKPIVKDP